MKRIMAILMACLIMCVGTSCQKEKTIEQEPRTSQVKTICELAVMDCYYHNVAKSYEKDVAGVLFWKKDRHFWVEYSGVVEFGVDASKVKMEVDGTQVTISIPEAKVLNSKVDSSSLTKESYIVAKNSVEITWEDETVAFENAEEHLMETASNDSTLLAMAQQRVQSLLEDYVNNIAEITGKKYTIKWIYLDDDNPAAVEVTPEATSKVE